MKKEKTHIGSIIEQKFRESSMTVQEFSNKINRERTTVYGIFKRETIDIETLIRISHALNFDFINEIYFNQKTVLQKPQTIFIAVEVDKNLLSKLDLPDNFIQLFQKTE